jgi:hypothetical protein
MSNLRENVRRRAGRRCEYCHLPERFSPFRFQLDHVIAKKHRGPKELLNLAWSCADCNAHKGSDLSSIDPETGTMQRLFNPRTNVWAEHFKVEDGEITGITAIGRSTVELLCFNRPDRVALRSELREAGLFAL